MRLRRHALRKQRRRLEEAQRIGRSADVAAQQSRSRFRRFAAIRLNRAERGSQVCGCASRWTRRASSELIVRRQSPRFGWRLLKGFVQHYCVNVTEFGVLPCSRRELASLVRPARRRCNGAAPHFALSSATSPSAHAAAPRSNWRVTPKKACWRRSARRNSHQLKHPQRSQYWADARPQGDRSGYGPGIGSSIGRFQILDHAPERSRRKREGFAVQHGQNRAAML